MYKDILVHIPTERPMSAVIDGSISLAANLTHTSTRSPSGTSRAALPMSWMAVPP